jgi:hypothetical protein
VLVPLLLVPQRCNQAIVQGVGKILVFVDVTITADRYLVVVSILNFWRLIQQARFSWTRAGILVLRLGGHDQDVSS